VCFIPPLSNYQYTTDPRMGEPESPTDITKDTLNFHYIDTLSIINNKKI
jgi:hypothetical protein